MGKLANTLRGVALPLDKQNQVRALDRELDDLKANERRLEAANVKLQAEAALPGHGIEHGEDSVSEITGKILVTIANTDMRKDSIIKSMGLSAAAGNRHLDVLLSKRYIVKTRSARDSVSYRATAAGCKYVARNNAH